MDPLARNRGSAALLPPLWADHYGERLAIMLESGAVAQNDAERIALAETLEAMKRPVVYCGCIECRRRRK